MHNVLGHTPEGLPLDPHIYILLCSDFDAINAAPGGFFCRLHRITRCYIMNLFLIDKSGYVFKEIAYRETLRDVL